MPSIRFTVDQCTAERISGWVDRDGPVASVDIYLDRRWIGSIAPIQFRRDLKEKDVGDGQRGFQFLLHGYVPQRLTLLELKTSGETIYTRFLNPGPVDQSEMRAESDVLLGYSQTRWKADEPEPDLTWGCMMNGDSLWEIYSSVRMFGARDRILEIGPGYGRLLQTAIKRNIEFASYTGLELSEARVARLNAEFGSDTIRFIAGDVNTWRGDEPFDVILCSSTFEHLYPDCSRALANLASQLLPGATVAIDFIATAPTAANFDPGGTYVRRYDEPELRRIFGDTGLPVVSIHDCILGEGAHGPVARSVVIASSHARSPDSIR